MDSEQLLALAARCEQATGPDRELDCRVAAACHPSMAGEFRVVGPPTYSEDRYFSAQAGMDWIGYDLLNNAPAYTASLDAAMGLAGDDPFSPLFEAMIRCPMAAFVKDLPRFVTASSLRARAASMKDGTHVGN